MDIVLSQWNYGAFTLTAQTLQPEQQNKVHHITLLASEIWKRVAHLPICEVRELPNWKQVIHLVADPDAQRLFQKFHRYGSNPELKGKKKVCPYQPGAIRENFIKLVGEDNLATNYEEESRLQRKILHKFFSPNKLKELKIDWQNIAQEWLEKQMHQPQVLLFEATHHLICQCLIHGIFGAKDCDEKDIHFNVEFWKKLLTPNVNKQKSVEEYEQEGEPGLFKKIWDFVVDAPENGNKIRHYLFEAEELNCLTTKIYQSTVSIEGSLCHYLVEEGFTDPMILENVKGLLIAGQETIAYLLGFMLYAYAKDPNMQKKHAAHPDEINNAYLETLRLYSVGGVQREAGMDLVLSYTDPENANEIKEHYIRKGEIIACAPKLSGHNPFKWENAEEFNADRLDLSQVKRNPHFGSGPHECIGKKAAELELFTIMETILAKARLEINVKLPDLLAAFTLRPKHDIYIKFMPINDELKEI